MNLFVIKFGGSSVSTISRIHNVSSIIEDLLKTGQKLVVVVSAMQGVTNHLVDLSRNFIDTNNDRESDVIISSGEQVSSGLLALCLKKKGILAESFQGWQIPIVTESNFGEASIISVNKDKLLKTISNGVVPVVSGFQGISVNNEITTIGRGGSDATAVAISSALAAKACVIYTDVDGVYTADPRIVLDAKRLSSISYEEMLVMANMGAKVLQMQSVKIAKEYNVKLKVLSSLVSEGNGTTIENHTSYISEHKVAGIAHNKSSFILKTRKKIPENIPIIKSEEDMFIINKLYHSEVKGDIDNDIGIVSIVGQKPADLNQDILYNLKKNNILVKNIYNFLNSLSIITPFQQTEIAVNILHKMLFCKN